MNSKRQPGPTCRHPASPCHCLPRLRSGHCGFPGGAGAHGASRSLEQGFHRPRHRHMDGRGGAWQGRVWRRRACQAVCEEPACSAAGSGAPLRLLVGSPRVRPGPPPASICRAAGPPVRQPPVHSALPVGILWPPGVQRLGRCWPASSLVKAGAPLCFLHRLAHPGAAACRGANDTNSDR